MIAALQIHKKPVKSKGYLPLYVLFVEGFMSQSKQLPQEFIYSQCAEDEISLVDLWLVIKKRKKIIYYSVIVFTLLSLLFALTRADKYQYKTTIEIGTKVVNGEFKKIESPSTALAKLNESYIPLVLSEYVRKHDPEHKNKYEIKARIPKNSEIIVLESKGREDQEAVYTQLLNQAAQKINQDHQDIIRLIQKNIDIEINKLSSQVQAYNDEIGLLTSKLKRQDEVAKLVKQEINNTDAILKSAVKNKQKAINEVKDESKALTLMLLNSEIRKAQEDSARLKEKLYVDVAETKDSLNKKIRDLKRKISSVHDQQSKLALEKESIKETSALLLPMKSLETVNVVWEIIVVVGAGIGFFVGVMFVFIAVFLQKVRSAEDEQDGI